MLTAFADLLAGRRRGTAVGAFTCYDLEEAAAVLSTATVAGTGVILLLGKQSYVAPSGELLLAALLSAAERSDAHACIQLDHCDDLGVIASALSAGVGAVMADGSSLPYEQNVEFVRQAVELAATHGAGVEAELGTIEGNEDVAEAVAAGALTEPDQALDFTRRTGAACLAVSIGNVHGVYRNPPELDWPRLADIHARVETPLSLHGASGVPEELTRRSIELGIAKINVNTELRGAYLAATQDILPSVLAGNRLAELHRAQAAAVADVVRAKLAAFDSASTA